MPDNPPYMLTPGTITKALEKIKIAATPERFTLDFLSDTLGMKGGTPRSLIPFLKRIGFLATDGSPTELYKRFRNPSESGAAVAQALRIGYQALFTMNEKTYELSENDLKGLIVQATGSEKGSRMVQAIFGSFKALKQYADFKEQVDVGKKEDITQATHPALPSGPSVGTETIGTKMNLSYTINLNLPPTSDIAVFNAIFKSLKENLLKK